MASVVEHMLAFFAGLGVSPAQGSVLLACSGGADSVALGAGLAELGWLGGVAHVDYGLRAASGEEAELVVALAAGWEVPCWVECVEKGHFEGDSGNLQAEARRIRYGFLEGLLREHGFDWCATGHHRDDQIETLLWSLLRSAGSFPKGIPPVRDRYVRPLLGLGKAELLAFVEGLGLPYAVDGSNLEPVYDRNFLRLALLPALEGFRPGFGERLLRLHGWERELAGFQACWYGEREGFWTARSRVGGEVVVLERLRKVLDGEGEALFWEWKGERLGLSVAERARLGDLLAGQAGKWVETREWELLRTSAGVHIRRRELGRLVREERGFSIEGPGHPVSGRLLPYWISVSEWERSGEGPLLPVEGGHWLDADAVAWPVRVRRWQPGDAVRLLGAPGRQKLSDLFVNAGWSRFEKEGALVLEDGQGIVLVGGFRVADRVKVRPDSSRLVRVKLDEVDF